MTDQKPIDGQEAATAAPPAADVPAWEQIEPGRYMPRRVRGSCRGLVLG